MDKTEIAVQKMAMGNIVGRGRVRAVCIVGRGSVRIWQWSNWPSMKHLLTSLVTSSCSKKLKNN